MKPLLETLVLLLMNEPSKSEANEKEEGGSYSPARQLAATRPFTCCTQHGGNPGLTQAKGWIS